MDPDKNPGFTAFVIPGHTEDELADMKFAGTLDETITGIASPGGNTTTTELPCRLVDPELFFAESPADVEFAKALCVDCPVQQACLAAALERGEPWGVWGGQLFVQGVVVPRKRPRGRPRKHPLPEPVTDPRIAPAARQTAEPVRPDRKEEAA